MSANIEELVKKHTCHDGLNITPAYYLRNALTEQAEAFKGELQAYDGMVRELTKTVEDMRAAQSVPVVGDAVAYLKADAAGKVLWSEDCVCEDAVWAGEDSEFGEYSLPVYRRPTHSITAAELATLREKAAQLEHELETERMRLAACGVIALSNTADSAINSRDMLPEYWSASAQDCASAVDREMDYRSRLVVAERERDELRKGAERMQKALADIAEWTDRYTAPGHPVSTIARAAIAQGKGE